MSDCEDCDRMDDEIYELGQEVLRLEKKISDAHRNAEISYDYLKDVMRGLER